MRLLLHPAAEAHIAAVVAHPRGAILLHGEAGTGKRTTAHELARRLNCKGCDNETCRPCRMITEGNHPDVITVKPDEKHKIGLEQVQELQHALQYQAYEAEARRVVIIEEADTATLPAQNALLKMLEEPPPRSVMILTAVSPQALLPTVLSRCSAIALPPLGSQMIERFIAESYREAPAKEIALLSRGAVGRAATYSTNPERMAADQRIAREIEAFLQASTLFERLKAANAIVSESDQRADYLNELWHQLKSSPALVDGLGALERLQQRLKANVNAKTAFEALAVELA